MNHTGSKRILVAMSGGVDSSVAAALLHQAGHQVVGISMKLLDPTGDSRHDPGNFEDAKKVADACGFSHSVIDLTRRFAREVIDDFVAEYRAGRTPNPCVHCNQALKFDLLRRQALDLGCDAVATGHYARIHHADGRYSLLKGLDPIKDQSYFLFTLTQEQMRRVLFPLGDMTKAEVRKTAEALGLSVAEKSESNEICFVPDDDYIAFLENRDPAFVRPGPIVNRQGETLGIHGGVHRYTIGQRKGLGIAFREPLFVLEIRPEDAVVVVGVRDELTATGLYASRMSWPDGLVPEAGTRAQVKIRYRQAGTPALLYPDEKGGCEIRFSEPVDSIAPGQCVVAYLDDKVLGGGWIERPLP